MFRKRMFIAVLALIATVMGADLVMPRGAAAAEVVVTVDDATGAEGAPGQYDGVVEFDFWLSEPSTEWVSVASEPGGGSATAEDYDWDAARTTTAIPPGETHAVLQIPVFGDYAHEWNNETFDLLLSSAQNATLARSSAVGTIIDNFPGVWAVTPDGDVHGSLSTPLFGGTRSLALAAPITGIEAHPSMMGYWLTAHDGGVFSFGETRYHGSMGGIPLNQPVVDIASTASGNGYWLAAADGGVFSFGDAQFFGSMGGVPLVSPVVAIEATPDGRGYWLFAADGGVFTFGNAPFFGSMGGAPLFEPVVDGEIAPGGTGYWMAADDGGVFTFGSAAFYGSTGGRSRLGSNIGIVSLPDGRGYWVMSARMIGNGFGAAPSPASMHNEFHHSREPAVAATGKSYF